MSIVIKIPILMVHKHAMVGSRIKHFRELNKYNRDWLAGHLGIDKSQVNRIENDLSEITVLRLYKIAQLFKISIIDLFEEKHLICEEPNTHQYGPVESSYIRFLIHQNDLARKQNSELTKTSEDLIKIIEAQQEQLKKLMDYVSQSGCHPDTRRGGLKRNPNPGIMNVIN